MSIVRIIASIIAALLLWYTAMLMDLDATGMALIRLLSVHFGYYDLILWPIIVVLSNLKWLLPRIMGRTCALAYFAYFPLFEAANLNSAIDSLPHDFHRYCSLVDAFGIGVMVIWAMCFLTIQYFIWVPSKVDVSLLNTIGKRLGAIH
jgi:hypothetical protein